MSQAANKPVEVGVVLQGGGALGAYECGALNALLELIDEFSAKGHRILLKVVSGVSIGSINAACVVGAKSSADARARLNAMWDDLMLETPPFWMHAAQRDLAYFGLPGFYTPRTDFWTAPSWTYVYDTRPLLVTLARHVDFAALNASATAFAVTAVEVVTGTLRAFVNRPLGKVPATKIEPRHVLASGSLPPGFPWTEIDGMPHWDGGLVDNTPLGLAIDAFSTDAEVDRMLVVMNLYPLRARLPRNLAVVEDRMHELSSAIACGRITTPRGASMRWWKRSTILPPWFPPRCLTSGCAPGWTKRAAIRSSTPSSTSTCRIRPPRSFPPRRTRPTTRMECAISPRRPWAAGAGTGSNSRTTSCGLRSRIVGVWRMRRSRRRQEVNVQVRQDR
jgi:NTE family protein